MISILSKAGRCRKGEHCLTPVWEPGTLCQCRRLELDRFVWDPGKQTHHIIVRHREEQKYLAFHKTGNTIWKPF